MNHDEISTNRSEEPLTDAGAAELAESLIGEAEPWEPWETRLCLWSLGIGIAALVVLGAVINLTILG